MSDTPRLMVRVAVRSVRAPPIPASLTVRAPQRAARSRTVRTTESESQIGPDSFITQALDRYLDRSPNVREVT
ncbi:hypothetical protein [Streptomyces albipurpureus]|uniref:Uncharacterized protein n=1 Tax=Streptomyces albipurpureus TaxID=2897419 RepID=A0ABT0V0V0_9ACTN|nr:hypothetical protein [Streptomyces sp. CWNU-1]MCM2394334.1 hypothetical protein [Streptomyces sp. CWNU-1]